VRRADREVTSREEIDGILRAALILRLAFARRNEPYVVPLSFGYDGSALYFHTATAGRKLDFIAANSRVCFEVEHDVRLQPHPDNPCSWDFAFESVIGYGRVSELVSPEERTYGLNQVMRHYADRENVFQPRHLAGVRVWRVDIESLTGKRSRSKPAEGE
jgi:nitroimidazol reductase NimA-like FMN-containing flavoprotein (pyridoxamine 5'-phosphate oxidase superfamily)